MTAVRLFLYVLVCRTGRRANGSPASDCHLGPMAAKTFMAKRSQSGVTSIVWHTANTFLPQSCTNVSIIFVLQEFNYLNKNCRILQWHVSASLRNWMQQCHISSTTVAVSSPVNLPRSLPRSRGSRRARTENWSYSPFDYVPRSPALPSDCWRKVNWTIPVHK